MGLSKYHVVGNKNSHLASEIGPTNTIRNWDVFHSHLQVDPSDYVEHLSEAMQVYHPIDYLCGDSIVYDYDSKVSLLLSCMSASHLYTEACNTSSLCQLKKE